MSSKLATPAKPVATEDVREQLFNQGERGLIHEVARPIDLISRLNGILFDIDPSLFQPSSIIIEPDSSPADFFERCVSPWLLRHPVLQKAEVRNSGRGLHVILRLDEPIWLQDELDRARWAARVRVIQSILPIDPNQPGINAMTRKIGSINSKNKGKVTLLKAGVGVTEAELLALVDEVGKKPFKLLAGVLLGTDGYIECPLCNENGLEVLDRHGRCYACKKVSTERLMKLVYADNPKKVKEVAHAE